MVEREGAEWCMVATEEPVGRRAAQAEWVGSEVGGLRAVRVAAEAVLGKVAEKAEAEGIVCGMCKC